MVCPGHRVTEALVEKMNDAFVLGNQRTAAQDVEFSFQQLVEIAVRALSPGVNDPFTAIACVDRLGSALCRLARRDMPSPLRFDDQGRLRLVAHRSTFAGIVDTAFNQIRQAARSNPAVAIRLLEAIARIAGRLQRAQDAACLQRHAGMIVAGAREAVPEANDRLAIEARFRAATGAARASRLTQGPLHRFPEHEKRRSTSNECGREPLVKTRPYPSSGRSARRRHSRRRPLHGLLQLALSPEAAPAAAASVALHHPAGAIRRAGSTPQGRWSQKLLRRRGADGTPHQVMCPLEFMPAADGADAAAATARANDRCSAADLYSHMLGSVRRRVYTSSISML